MVKALWLATGQQHGQRVLGPAIISSGTSTAGCVAALPLQRSPQRGTWVSAGQAAGAVGPRLKTWPVQLHSGIHNVEKLLQ